MVKQNVKLGGSIVGEAAPESSALHAYYALLDLTRGSAVLVGAEAVIFALSWLAAGRLLVRGEVAGFGNFDDMLKLEFWRVASRSGMPEESLSAVWGRSIDLRQGHEVHVQALSITQTLLREDAEGDWALFDTVWDFSNSKLVGKELFNCAYDANLCDLLFNLLGATPGSTVWIPFDLSGQLTVRALRRGLRPLAVGPGWLRPNPIARLLLLLEPRELHVYTPEFDVAKDGDNRPIITTDFLIACPPLGAKVIAGMGWGKWEISPVGEWGTESILRKAVGRHFVQLDRTDSWAIAAFWPAVSKRAVFMTLPNVLFAKGQEQRLRENLVRDGQKLAAVVALPGRLVQGTGVVTALTVMDRAHDRPSVRMADAIGCTVETKSTMRFSRILDATKVSELVLGLETEDGISTDVPYDQIAEQDFNLVPSRYLRQVEASDQVERVSLGQLVEAIRAPVTSKDDNAVTVSEVGIPELDRWQPIAGPIEKSTSVQPRKLHDCALRDGDILLSIKGTIGKTGLVGRDQALSEPPAVSSQSCVILRVTSKQITPLQLFLYLRSDDFKRQAEAFKVGVSVAHVTPATLLQDVKVPVSLLTDHSSALDRYEELCELENGIDKAHQRLKEIQAGL